MLAKMFLYTVALRLYGYLITHLSGLWTLLWQFVAFCNGNLPKRFNFIRQEQKIFVVTGGTRGIGRKVAERLMSLGAFVVITGRKAPGDSSLKRVFEDLSALSSRYQYIQVDLSSMAETVRFSELVKTSFPQIDGLVCNAGGFNSAYRPSAEGFEATQASNYLSVVVLVDRLKSTLKRNQGRIILVSSTVHKIGYCNLDDFLFRNGYSGHLAYAQSKLALVSYTRHMAASLLERYGVTLNSVHPGIVHTDMYQSHALVNFIGSILFMSTFTSAETILFPLLSNALEGVTGQYMDLFEVASPSRKVKQAEFPKRLHEVTRDLVGQWLLPDGEK